ncbi:hypothetical protein CPAR01_04632 [Colletotrichum paranaense]|uniref:Uncharacterized protein n=2 Tax=Colletotrichum acutatum species complex TaxID=2707335 RepID=A0AAI9TYW9_9PEZI|nr:uncharacterized protein CPAR01_04632 [Colletotrichum paranaense]KAK1447412.1 hypothetical protein CMEL01_09251 [Colletotrichum melonis]KAK1543999.1 hypothetical protein CPAR01_04632 [Colletotrichum paranaense]
MECSYLSWEVDALVNPLREVTETCTFNPQTPLAYFANNYVLSFDDFTDLDKAAKSTVTLNPNTIAKVFLVLRGVVSGKNEDNRAKLENFD